MSLFHWSGRDVGIGCPCYAPPIDSLSLRFDGETEDEFRSRTEQAGRIARVLVAACMRNRCILEYLADPSSLHTVETVLRCPTVRVEYEQAIAIGGIGECLAATKNKVWGAGPSVMPLEPDDFFYPDRITYLFRATSIYNRRFHQRRRMKALLGIHRKLVGEAKSNTKELFLRHLTAEQIKAIERVFHVGPGMFWRAAKGAAFLALAPEFVQGELDFGD